MAEPFRRSYSIRYDEVDLLNRLTPVTILNCCQDAASRHARLLGVSVGDLRRLGLTWVLSRFRLILDRYPSPGEGVAVTTWPSTREGLFSCREFTLANDKGACWGRATSSWAAIDLQSRRPVRLAERLPDYPVSASRAVSDPFATLPHPERMDQELTLPVMRRDLDQNQHVNNAVYLAWALEAVPEELFLRSQPHDLALNFRAEARGGETVRSLLQLVEDEESPVCRHQIMAGDGRELARIVTAWGPCRRTPSPGSLPCPSSTP
jgi:acyl-ACP thioesterase